MVMLWSPAGKVFRAQKIGVYRFDFSPFRQFSLKIENGMMEYIKPETEAEWHETRLGSTARAA